MIGTTGCYTELPTFKKKFLVKLQFIATFTKKTKSALVFSDIGPTGMQRSNVGRVEAVKNIHDQGLKLHFNKFFIEQFSALQLEQSVKTSTPSF